MFSDPKYSFSVYQKYFFAVSKKVNIFSPFSTYIYEFKRWSKDGKPTGNKKPKRCGVKITRAEEEDVGAWEITRTPEDGEAKTDTFNVR